MTTGTILADCLICGEQRSICEINGEHDIWRSRYSKERAVHKILNLVYVKIGFKFSVRKMEIEVVEILNALLKEC